MARIRYVPHDQDREDIKAEDKAERRAMRNCSITPEVNDPNFGKLDPTDPEFESVDEFADWMADDERAEYDHHELSCLNHRTGLRLQVIREALEEYGMTLKTRRVERAIRGYNAWDNNRWSSPC